MIGPRTYSPILTSSLVSALLATHATNAFAENASQPASTPADTVATTTVTSAQLADTGAESKGLPPPQPPPPQNAPNGEKDAPADFERAGGEYRTIEGYRFITPIEAYSAFANTSFRFAQGFGVFSFELPSPITGAPTQGRLFAYGQQLFGQIGIANRVAIDLRAEGAAGIGGNLDSILGIGALATLNAGAMPKVRLLTLKAPALQVSLGTGAFYTRTISIRPSALIGKVAGDVPAAESQVIRQVGNLNIVPAVMAAIALGPVGLQTSIAPSFGVAGDTKETGLTTGLHGALDLHRITSTVPVAIVVEWGLTKTFGAAGSTTNSLGGGFYYSGRRDLELGIIARVQPGDVAILQGQLVMQYYF